jgi:hypothetical protein
MNGASDSGDMSVEDVNAIFGTRDGYKASSPVVSAPDEAAGTPSSVENYDF